MPQVLDPTAQTICRLISAGEITAADLHPKIFEAVNKALIHAACEPLKIERAAAFKMDVSFDQLRMS